MPQTIMAIPSSQKSIINVNAVKFELTGWDIERRLSDLIQEHVTWHLEQNVA